jgi:hypothetical protein
MMRESAARKADDAVEPSQNTAAPKK